MLSAVGAPEVVAGKAYNIGGGPERTISVWREFGPILESLRGRPLEISYHAWRPGDQKVFVSDIRRAKADLGWEPCVSVEDGIRRLFEWVGQNPELFDA